LHIFLLGKDFYIYIWRTDEWRLLEIGKKLGFIREISHKDTKGTKITKKREEGVGIRE
jgi:hypothetical protein